MVQKIRNLSPIFKTINYRIKWDKAILENNIHESTISHDINTSTISSNSPTRSQKHLQNNPNPTIHYRKSLFEKKTTNGFK